MRTSYAFWLPAGADSNTVMLGVLILLFATIGTGTPVWLIVLHMSASAFSRRCQYTSMNTLVYADVPKRRPAGREHHFSTAQQSRSVSAWHRRRSSPRSFIPDRFHADGQQMIHGTTRHFLVLAG